MTGQLPEMIRVGGVEHPLLELPLSGWLHSLGLGTFFVVPHTACYRGYLGTWEVQDDRLFLIGLTRWVRPKPTVQQGSTQFNFHEFGGRTLPIHAEWLTTELHAGLGQSERHGFGLIFEQKHVFDVLAGRVVETSERANPEWLRIFGARDAAESDGGGTTMHGGALASASDPAWDLQLPAHITPTHCGDLPLPEATLPPKSVPPGA